MSAEETPANGQARYAQVDELVRAMQRNAVATTALAAAIGALTIAVAKNTDAIEEMLAADEHDEDCDDSACEGECLEEPEPPKRRKRR